MKNYKTGVYKTIYGNACYYIEGDTEVEDLDMRKEISIEMVDFSKFIREEQ